MEDLLGRKVLLVGEGDFSFAMSLWNRMLAQNLAGDCEIMATSLETEQSIMKHQCAAVNMSWLTEKGVCVKLNTDATQLHMNSAFQAADFDTIVFNFPHVGGKSNHKKNRQLLNDFFASSSKLLTPAGRVLVTLCKGQGGTPADRPIRAWHDSWQVVSMAANSSLVLKAVRPFNVKDYNTYSSTGFRSLDKGFHTDNALTHVFGRATAVDVPSHVQDAVVEIHQQKFSCPPYLLNKLKCIRDVNNNSDHPVHRLYHHITSLLQSAASCSGNTVVDQGLQECPISQSILLDGTSIQNNAYLSSNKLQVRNASHMEAYILPQIKSEEFIDCQKIEVCDKFEHSKAFEGIHDVSFVSSSIEFVQRIPDLTLDSVVCTYGPIFTRGCIKKQEFPVTYHMSIMCTIPDENIVDALNSEKNTVTKFIGMLNSSLGISIYPLQVKESTSANDDGFVKILDLVKTNTAEDEQTEQCYGCIYQSNVTWSIGQQHVLVTCNLCTLACNIFSIPDERLLWSVEPGTTKQFSPETVEGTESCNTAFDDSNGISTLNSKRELPIFKFQTVSLYPMSCIHDMSFWEKDGTEFDELLFSDCIRDVVGDNVVSVWLKDEYRDSTSGKKSRCYRLTFQSADEAMSYDASWQLQSTIRIYVQDRMGITLR